MVATEIVSRDRSMVTASSAGFSARTSATERARHLAGSASRTVLDSDGEAINRFDVSNLPTIEIGIQMGSREVCKSEARNPKSEIRKTARLGIRISDFGLLSDFGLRISDLLPSQA